MKKFAVLIYILAVILVGCSKDIPRHEAVDDFADVTIIDSDTGAFPSFTATVIEVNDGSMLVAPDEGTNARASSDMIYVSTKVSGSGKVCDMTEGERICVYYDGSIAETYPAQISGTVAIHKVDKDGNILKNAARINLSFYFF